jgi:hypothetical protein
VIVGMAAPPKPQTRLEGTELWRPVVIGGEAGRRRLKMTPGSDRTIVMS